MYDQVTAALIGSGSEPGALATLANEVGDTFIAILPVAIPVVGAIAIGFFAIRTVRGLLHA